MAPTAVAVSVCGEHALCFCQVALHYTGLYKVRFEYVELEDATDDAIVLLRAVRAATLLREDTAVVVSGVL